MQVELELEVQAVWFFCKDSEFSYTNGTFYNSKLLAGLAPKTIILEKKLLGL